MIFVDRIFASTRLGTGSHSLKTPVEILRNAIKNGILRYVLDRLFVIEQSADNDFNGLVPLSLLEYINVRRFSTLPQQYMIQLHELKLACSKDMLDLNLYEHKRKVEQ